MSVPRERTDQPARRLDRSRGSGGVDAPFPEGLRGVGPRTAPGDPAGGAVETRGGSGHESHTLPGQASPGMHVRVIRCPPVCYDLHHARVDPVEDLGPFVPGTRTQHLGETFPKFGPAFLVPLVGKFLTVEPDTLQEGRVELRFDAPDRHMTPVGAFV